MKYTRLRSGKIGLRVCLMAVQTTKPFWSQSARAWKPFVMLATLWRVDFLRIGSTHFQLKSGVMRQARHPKLHFTI